jgi:LCP family protein required for cell wall assembly
MDRVNSAYSLGGPATLMDTLAENYKIIIDHYISVDLVSFPKLINALGGVRVDVTEQEAAYINRTSPSMNGEFPAGKQVKLNGQQALVFTRIRKLDSDVNRSARQRRVITAILQSASDANPRQVLDALRQTLKHVVTGLSEDEIDRLSKDALTQGWFNYEVRQLHSPLIEETSSPTGFSTYIDGRWFWVVDYPREAQRLQNELYGVTNIELAQDGRDDYLAALFRD